MKQKTNAEITIPDHILDQVAQTAENYFANSQDRLLGAYSEEAKQKIRNLSTHTKVRSPERRELHRKIITHLISDAIKAQKSPSTRPTMILFAGPAGAGKSTLRKRFDEGNITEKDSPELQKAYKIYKEAAAANVSIDFEFFKSQLPEYRAANTAFKEKYGDMYAVIRSECSGLDVATRQLAKELGLTTITEQLMDADHRHNPEKSPLSKDYNLIVIGLTAEPETIRQRVMSRKNPMQDKEVVKAIKGFSSDNAFGYLSEIAENSFLFKSADKAFTPVFAAQKGKETYKDATLYEAFKQLEKFEPKEKEVAAGISR